MIIRVPQDLYQSALQDIDKFIRDIACVPRTGMSPFIRRRKKVDACIKDYENPFNPFTLKFIDSFICKDRFMRYAHFDLAKNRDAVGVSMAHVPFFDEREIYEERLGKTKKAKAPHVRVDFWGRIKVQKGEEIILSDIREIIYELSRRHFYFGVISFDNFQSLDSMQILRTYGYRVGHFSLDRTSSVLKIDSEVLTGLKKLSTEGNTNYGVGVLRDLMYDDRLDVPKLNKNYYDKDYFSEECKQAQETKRGKIDHPPNFSIDVMHSVAGSTTHAIVNEIATLLNESEFQYEEDKLYAQKNNQLKRNEFEEYIMNTDPIYQSQDPIDIYQRSGPK
ncbi:MAG: hypothetical protein NUV97_01390 [archaeon]|nr:hypothetical protein [archaeon]